MNIKEYLAKLSDSLAEVADDFKAFAAKHKQHITAALAGVWIFVVGYALGKKKGEDRRCKSRLEFIEGHTELCSACNDAGSEATFPIPVGVEVDKNPSTTTVLKALAKGLTGKSDVSEIVSDWGEDPTSAFAVTIWSKKSER